jgi:very-short-patch-repair endonuclease
MKKHPMKGATARSRSLRQTMTDAERCLWQKIRLAQLSGYRFRRQVPFGPYITDFACHEARLVIELDGGQHDLSSPQEIIHTQFLEKEGYRVLRFWNPDVLKNLEGVCETILNVLQEQKSKQEFPKALPLDGGGWGGGESHSTKTSPPPPKPRICFANPGFCSSPIKGEEINETAS